MAYAATPLRSQEWDPDWNPEILKGELRKRDKSLKKILIHHSNDVTGWQGLYGDVQRWRKEDLELSSLLIAHVKALGMNIPPGRNRLDNTPETDSWKRDFCEEYLKTRSKIKATVKTPYSYDYVLKKLDPKRTEYDQVFADMVEACDMQFLDWVKEAAYQSLQDAISTRASPKDRAWIATTIAKIAKNTDWGTQRVDMKLTGSLKFEAQRMLMTSELAAEQREMFAKNRQPLLESGARDFIDVDLVEEKVMVSGE